ncbi:RimK family alpha-L-glutamate ligase [Zoogloea sp.]|uniref:ATP-grasp domain-containing protein n=1 Tax=Zoogloea sp. TaxID=49181 RepID=UPI0035B4687C
MQAKPRIALVTGAEMAKPDPETHYLVAALAQLGVAADIVPWDAPVDWAAWPLVVVRTPWDYFRRLPEFLAWAERTRRLARFVNPYEVIDWNSHKQYLRGLAEAGIATVPTLWLDHGCGDARARLAARGWGEVVVKPAVSIGAIGALRAAALDPACLEHLDRLVAEGDVMVQPFVASVAEAGEVSLVYFGGRFSHAIRKQPAPGDFRVQDMYGGTVHPHQPTAAELAVADAVLARTPAPTTYARIDLVEFDGAPALMEAELIEPELFLGATPEAATNFARVLAGMV